MDKLRTTMVTLLFAMIFATTVSCEQTANSSSKQTTDKSKQEDNVANDKEKKMENGLYAEMTTNKGVITIKLEMEKTPITVTNFVGLAEGTIDNMEKEAGVPFYDGLIFHRVISDFMIQGGDPKGTGRGGPGYRFGDEIDPTLNHDAAGILSMANAGPGTNGSQFFITHLPTPHLNGKHTVFGKVVEGLSVVMDIRQNDTIETLKIIRVGAEAEAFTATQKDFDALQQKIKDEENAKNEEANKDMVEKVKELYPEAIKADEGYYYVVTKEGEGDTPKPMTKITAHYTGKFMDGKKFDSSVDRNEPFKFTVAAGEVIQGWDLAFLAMNRGEKRTIILPSDLAYGDRGYPGAIPPKAWLIFDVELISF